jgi:hypothetical protein
MRSPSEHLVETNESFCASNIRSTHRTSHAVQPHTEGIPDAPRMQAGLAVGSDGRREASGVRVVVNNCAMLHRAAPAPYTLRTCSSLSMCTTEKK